ncbi:MAG TPA: SDR family oxidoreductase [Casimicrobiaceae bacterium]|nr:SDR family oxidoreductase [Casimicrobiaceae bacterium]
MIATSLRHDGRVALVTGASSGIGRALAHAFAAAGASVVLAARRADVLASVADAIRATGGAAVAVAADLGSRDGAERLADAAAQPFGAPSILVNAAGINIRKPILELTAGDIDSTLAINLVAPLVLAQRLAPAMLAAGFGRILNITSQQQSRAFNHSGIYGASKGGLAALTRSMAEAWSAAGVTTNAIAPGLVATPMTAAVLADPARAKALAARTMVGRNGVPDDLTGAALFLASEAAAYITGQTLFVDGGFSVT